MALMVSSFRFHSDVLTFFLLFIFILSSCGGSGNQNNDGEEAFGTDAGLAALELSSGTLSPDFDAITTQYSVQVVNAVSSLTVTPTLADPNATITVNGEPVKSGAATEPIALEVGFNSIDIVVTAQDGVGTRTYTLAVERNSGFWSWVSGDNALDQTGVYGEKGVADALNKPGSRADSIAWADGDGNLWLFGGFGYDGSTTGCLGDLWKFDGNWSWVSGDNTVDQTAVYGTQGIADAANTPGARTESVGWMYGGHFWLFGGFSPGGHLGDLWKFDGAQWTWVSGISTTNQTGVYGTQGVADETNRPGTRRGSVGWTDGNGNLWLFGGYGRDGSGLGYLGDLWKFDGTHWTWVSGSSAINQGGIYGVKGEANAANRPGARQGSVGWTDGEGNLWLFGGYYFYRTTLKSYPCYFNDLWKFDGTSWTWVAGDDTVNQAGVYGTKGIADASNKPGGRQVSTGWTDGNGHFWLFGGTGYSGSGLGTLNDLWKFEGTSWTWVSGDSTANQTGEYGTKGVADAANKPGARSGGVGWVDGNDHLWFFGGDGYHVTRGRFNDLWVFEP